MYNLYRGNSGRVQRVEEQKPHEQPARNIPSASPPVQVKPPQTVPKALSQITELLPKTLSELETEDILLMLILYLMYRESGDSELLIIMGAMFLL